MTSLPHKSLPLISYEKNNQILQTMELPTTGTQIFTLFIFLFFQLFPFILTSPDLSDINPQKLKSQQLQTPSQEPNSEEPQTPPQNFNSEEPQNPPQEPNYKLHNNPPQNPTAQHFQPKIPPKPNSQQPQNPPQKSNYKQTNNPPQNPKSQPKIFRTPNPEEPQTPPQNYNSHQPQNPPKKPNYKQTNNPPQNPKSQPKIFRKPNSEEPQTPSQKSNSPQPQNPPQNPKSQYFQPKIPRLLPHFRQSEQEQFLNAHNKARAHAGLSLFVWDETLASYARTWAKKRSSDCRMKHSNGPYGENIFWGGRDHWTPKDVVKLWVKEHKFYNRKTNACQPGKLCGHYTQIVWSDSIKVGCARAKCANGGIFVICSYDPPGNYANENPFKPNNNNNDTNNDNNNIKQ